MFAKIVNEHTITRAPRVVYIGETTYTNPTAEIYAEAGYYEVVDGEIIDTPKKWYHLVDNYTLDDTRGRPIIIHTVTEEKDAEPYYEYLIVQYIREAYSINDELALQRQRDNSEDKRQEFETYNAFCDSCKERARADVAEWEQA